MAQYRDPKVTVTDTKNDTTKWVGIALAALAAIVVLWWLFAADNEPVVTQTDPPVVVTETADPAAPVAPAAPVPAPATTAN